MPALLNLRILSTSLAHSLRALSIVSFPPAFILLLISGISAQEVNPAIGILPLFFSSAYSLALLANEKRCGGTHAYFVGRQVYDAFQPGAKYPSACSQCQYFSFPQISVKFQGGSGAGYKPLLNEEGRPEGETGEQQGAEQIV
ncbi:hypothetical protein N0V90_004530 [Kalmusia sp. IMI 367209]|nr:hypothetical protein N0V90_004530 [Kalmusia sp. IMI 367209]